MVFSTLMKLSGLAPSLSHRPPLLAPPLEKHTHTANLHTPQTRRDATNKLDIECCLAIQRDSQTHTPYEVPFSHTPASSCTQSRMPPALGQCVCLCLGILRQQKRKYMYERQATWIPMNLCIPAMITELIEATGICMQSTFFFVARIQEIKTKMSPYIFFGCTILLTPTPTVNVHLKTSLYSSSCSILTAKFPSELLIYASYIPQLQ